MDCGTSMVKYTLFVFNSLCSILGILVICYGWMLLNSFPHIEINGHTAYGPEALVPLLVITLGSFILFVSFLGCCGAIRESYCMSMMYATFLLILLVAQLMLVVTLWSNKKQFVDATGEAIDRIWEAEEQQPGIMAGLEKTFHCCGASSPLDYTLHLRKIPSSCCASGGDCINPLDMYKTGCKSKLMDVWSDNSEILKKAGLILIAIELIGFIFACCLANNIRNYKRRAAY